MEDKAVRVARLVFGSENMDTAGAARDRSQNAVPLVFALGYQRMILITNTYCLV